MKRILIMLLAFTLVTSISCKKDTFKVYEIEKSHFSDDDVLFKKYIDPLASSAVIKLTLKPRKMDSNQTFYLKKNTDGSYDMLGILPPAIDPVKIKVIFKTQANVATVNFSFASHFPGVIVDMGEELTRGADIEYSFVRAKDNIMQLEGNSYGDYLEMTPLIPESAEYQMIANNSPTKWYNTIKAFFNTTPIVGIQTDQNRTVQLAINMNKLEAWVFYSGNLADRSFGSTAIYNFTPKTSKKVKLTIKGLLDTVEVINARTEMQFDGIIIKGFAFNESRTKITALIQNVNQNTVQAVPIEAVNYPVVTFSEMAAYKKSQRQSDVYYQYILTAEERSQIDFERTFNMPVEFSFSLDSVANDPNYSIGWSSETKKQAIAIRNSIKRIDPAAIPLRFKITPTAVDLFDIAVLHDFKVTYKLNGIEQILKYTASMTARKFSPVTIYGFDNIFMQAVPVPANGSKEGVIWPEVSQFLKLYENSKLKLSYLPPSASSGAIRVAMKNNASNEVFIGTCF